jgi:hypothetical protein
MLVVSLISLLLLKERLVRGEKDAEVKDNNSEKDAEVKDNKSEKDAEVEVY